MKVELISYTPNPAYTIDKAASICYNSKPTKEGKILEHCFKSGHHSVLEFADFHFVVTGISRATSHQLVRHRMASYAQRSQRYCVEDNFEYVTPHSILHSPIAKETFEDVMEIIKDCYNKLIDANVPAEDARAILPNACCTSINIKMNFRELMHFMNERLCACAQDEIRLMAEKMRQEVVKVFPQAKDKLVPKCERFLPLCFCSEGDRSCGMYPTINEIVEKLAE